MYIYIAHTYTHTHAHTNTHARTHTNTHTRANTHTHSEDMIGCVHDDGNSAYFT
jgi:hypothetical protein